MRSGEWTGIIHTGLIQRGGETTGLGLETESGMLELQPVSDDIDTAIRSLRGREAIVAGDLGTAWGPERGDYEVIRVESIRAV